MGERRLPWMRTGLDLTPTPDHMALMHALRAHRRLVRARYGTAGYTEMELRHRDVVRSFSTEEWCRNGE